MVKLRRVRPKVSKSQNSIVVVDQPRVDRLRLLRGKRGRYVLVAGLLVFAIASFLIYRTVDNRANPPEVQISDEETAIQKNLDKLTASKPAEDAPKQDKVTYYDELSYAQAEYGDYKAAKAAFEQRQGLESSDLDYRDYIRFAQYCYNAGDRPAANAALDVALNKLPEASDEETGYEKGIFIERINYLRGEYSR